MVLKVWWRGRCVESTDGVSQGPFPEDIDERHVSLKVTVTWMPGLVNGLESCLDCSAGYFAKSSGLRAKAFGLTFAPLHHSPTDMCSLCSTLVIQVGVLDGILS